MVNSGLVNLLMYAKMHLKCSLLIVGKLFSPAHNVVFSSAAGVARHQDGRTD